VIALSSLLVLAVAACPGRAPRGPLDVSKGGVRLHELGRRELPFAPRVQGRPGDFLLESNRVRLVVGVDGHASAERRLLAGKLLDLTTRRFPDDDLGALEIVARAGDRPVPLAVRRVEAIEHDGRPALRIVQHSDRPALDVRTRVSVASGQPWVDLETSVVNRGKKPLRAVAVGDRSHWPGRPPFVPGPGYMDQAADVRAPWFARRGHKLSYALASPDGPLDLHFGVGLHGPDEETALSRSRDLAPGEKLVHRRRFIVVPGGVSQAAEVAWSVAGRRIGHIAGRLDPVPRWATLEALDAQGRSMLLVEARHDGRFSLALPAGDYRLVLRAPGGTDTEPVHVLAGAPPAEPRMIVPKARTLTYRVTDTQNAPLPARIVVRGLPPTSDPSFGPPQLASGAGMVAYTPDGRGELELPPGRYRVLFTHGIEYSLAESKIDVTELSGATLRATLRHEVETPRWLPSDFHVHAAPSADSDVPLHDRVIALMAEGIEFAVATDHNHVTDYGPAVTALHARPHFGFTEGVEITTASWGHFNAFPYPLGDPPPYADITPDHIFQSVRTRAPRAIIQVNHPRLDRDIAYFTLGKLDPTNGKAGRAGFSFDFDSIEIFNGFARSRLQVVEHNLRDWYALMNLGLVYTGVGNSDSHKLVYQWAGYPRTYVELDDDRPADVTPGAVADALRAHRAMVTTGPFVELRVQGAGPGSQVEASDGKVRVGLRVRAASWIDVSRAGIIVNGEHAADVPLAKGGGVTRIDWSGELSLPRDAFVLAVVRGDRPMDEVLPGMRRLPFAFTNPVFVDVDGDGVFTAQNSSAAEADGGEPPTADASGPAAATSSRPGP
jgi:hypothetical protein